LIPRLDAGRFCLQLSKLLAIMPLLNRWGILVVSRGEFMNKNFKKSLVCFSFVFLMSGFVPSALSAVDKGEHIDFGKIVDTFYSALKTVKGLNYYTTDGVRFNVLGQEVLFDFGFAGHGNLFMPLTSVGAKFISNRESTAAQFADITLSSLAKTVIENEVQKNGKNIEFLKWLLNCKLSPFQLFSFKVLILLNTARMDGDWVRLSEETFCLLFRLSQSKDLEFLGKGKHFSDYLPETIKNLLRESRLGLVEFVDDLWSVLTQDKNGSTQVATTPVQVNGFVFRNEDFAKKIYANFKDYSGDDLDNQISIFVETQRYDLVDMRDFTSFRKDKKSGENEFAEKLVGHEEFLLSSNSGKPVELITQVNALGSKPGLIFASDSIRHEYWVAHVTQDLSMINSLKGVILVLAGSFKDYLQTKREFFYGAEDLSLKYKAEFDTAERRHIELEKFVRSEDNWLVLEAIKHEIDLIISADDDSGQDKVSKLESDIVRLEKQREEKTAELAKWQNLLFFWNGKNAKDTQRKIDETNAEISKIKAKLNAFQSDGLREKTDKKLAQLYEILDEKKAKGEAPSDKLLEAIKCLEQQIDESSKQPVQTKSIDEKLAVRESVAKFLENKAKELSAKAQLQLKKLEEIDDLEDRLIQEIIIDESIHLQKVFIEQLERVAGTIRSDNDKAKKLDAYRRAFALLSEDKITDEKLQEKNRLELEVGHILDGDNHEDFVAAIMARESFLSSFVKDMTEYSDRFMIIKQRLQNSLSQILQNSSHLKENTKLYAYLWRHSIPCAWRSFLSCVGISEQSFI
jgi:hypothetical protein